MHPQSRGAISRVPFPVKAKRVPIALKAVGSTDLTYKTEKRLGKDQFSVALATGGHSDVLTFHRPVGRFDPATYPPGSWCCTRATEVDDLLRNAKNPSTPRIEEQRRSAILARLANVVPPLLVLRGQDYCYPGHEDLGPRSVLLRTARAAVSKAAAEEAIMPGADPPFLALLPDPCRALERGIMEALAAPDDGTVNPHRAAVALQFPDTYVTRSGPNADIDQRRVAYLDGAPPAQALALVRRRVLGTDP